VSPKEAPLARPVRVDVPVRGGGASRTRTPISRAFPSAPAAAALGLLLAIGWLAAVTALSPPAQAAPLAGTGTAVAGSRWQAPLVGALQIARRFQPPATRYGRGHRGVDLAAAPGAEVLSAGDGVVSFAGSLAGRGVVVVTSGALRTTYEPVVALVRHEDRVRRGQQLGRLTAGHPGCVAEACLHWGLLRGQRYLDPLSLLHPVRVRLLPLTRLREAAPVLSSVPVVPRPRATRSTTGTTDRSAVPVGVPAGAAIALGLTVVEAAGVRAARHPSRGPPLSASQDGRASVRRAT